MSHHQRVILEFITLSDLIYGTRFKANNLAHIEPRWYGIRIPADCQQKLLFTKLDTSGRFLLVTFLEKCSTLLVPSEKLVPACGFRRYPSNQHFRHTEIQSHDLEASRE